jgi:hypothetical protein
MWSTQVKARRIAVQELTMPVVSVAIRGGIFLSKASTPETAPFWKRTFVLDFTNTPGVNCPPVGETVLTTRRQGTISQDRKVYDAQ